MSIAANLMSQGFDMLERQMQRDAAHNRDSYDNHIEKILLQISGHLSVYRQNLSVDALQDVSSLPRMINVSGTCRRKDIITLGDLYKSTTVIEPVLRDSLSYLDGFTDQTSMEILQCGITEMLHEYVGVD